MAIEIKATQQITDKHLKGLRTLKEERLLRRYIAVSLDHGERRTSDGIEILPWQVFLDRLWSGGDRVTESQLPAKGPTRAVRYNLHRSLDPTVLPEGRVSLLAALRVRGCR